MAALASHAGDYEAVMQHAVSCNNQKRASPSVDLILSESEPRMDKKHAAGRGREARNAHARTLSLCFKELDLLIEAILMNLQFEGNNTTIYCCELLPSQGQDKGKKIPRVRLDMAACQFLHHHWNAFV